VLTLLCAIPAYVRARIGGPRAREEGVTAVEYALMVAIIAVLLVGAFYALYSAVDARYGQVKDCVAGTPAPSPDECIPPGGGGE
jgi:Flp pilus assembly pilin Flp